MSSVTAVSRGAQTRCLIIVNILYLTIIYSYNLTCGH